MRIPVTKLVISPVKNKLLDDPSIHVRQRDGIWDRSGPRSIVVMSADSGYSL